MKTSNLTWLTLLLFFCTSQLFAQDPPYILVTTTGTYANLENPTELTSVGDLWDDPSFTIPIGFNFEFLGETSNTLIMNDDFVGGSVGLPATFNGVTSQLFAFLDDVIDRENSDPNLQSSISYLVEGAPGEQIFKIEWKDVGFYSEWDNTGTAENIVNFQLWIYEGSNNFEIRYGPSNIVDTTGSIYDFNGPSSGILDSFDLNTEVFNEFWLLSGDPLKPSLVDIPDFTSIYTTDALSDMPMDGMVYQFLNPLSNTVNFAKSNAMKVYPNLVSNQFFVEVNEDILSEKTTFALNDQLGRPIYNKEITNTKTELSLEGFPSGFYYATIFNDKGLGTAKIVKVD